MDRNPHLSKAPMAAAARDRADVQRQGELSPRQLRQVWNEADTIPGRSPEKWRRDRLGNILRKGSFGTRGRFGWTVAYASRWSDAGARPVPALEAIHAQVRGRESAPPAPGRTRAAPAVAATGPAAVRSLLPSFPAPGTVRRSDIFPA
jgi:hypothetical protein